MPVAPPCEGIVLTFEDKIPDDTGRTELTDKSHATSTPPDGTLRPMPRWRANGALLCVLAALFTHFVYFVHGHRPLDTWLVWHFLAIWLASLVFAFACLGLGLRALAWAHPARLPLHERLAVAFALGVFVYFLAVFGLGLVGALNGWTFFALPAAFIVGGVRPLRALGQSLFRLARVRARRPAKSSRLVRLAWLFGLACLALLYFLILSPANLGFDATWKHLTIAEHYARAGRVEPFAEGWYPGTAPHLPSFLYTWAFLLPWGDAFDQIELAAHLEFVVFAFSLLSIPAIVRRVAPEVGRGGTWAVRFLFPGVFLYDSSLNGGADHIAAVFTGPVFLLTLHLWRRFDARAGVHLAVVAAGCALCKYSSAIAVLAFPVVAFAVRLGLDLRSVHRLRALRAAGAGLVAGLVFTAPHWLKNWLWYGDPLYPQGHSRFDLHPWTAESLDAFKYCYLQGQWRPTPGWAGVRETLGAVFSFAYVPHDWGKLHGKLPVFGTLLTMSLACLPLLGRRRGPGALWGLFACVHLGIACWFMVHHQDRHLQTLVPLMAAATAAVLGLLWQKGTAVRVATAGLVAAQVLWSADVYFLPTHSMIGDSPIKKVVDLLGSTYMREPARRTDSLGSIYDLGRTLPADARVLLHEIHGHLGLGAPSVSDFGSWQGGISYGREPGRTGVDRLLRGLGVTHLVWDAGRSQGHAAFASDLQFFDYALNAASPPDAHGRLRLAVMPDVAPNERSPDRGETVAWLGCGAPMADGLYPLAALAFSPFGPKPFAWPAPSTPRGTLPAERLVAAAHFVVVERGCAARMPRNAAAEFHPVIVRTPRAPSEFTREAKGETHELWVRRSRAGDTK